ncbi:MAG: DNA cytosine methyltransferase [Propionivibrio sp.]
MPSTPILERCCVASEGAQTDRRTWSDFCELQGLPKDFRLDQFTQSARYRAVGNGVPVPMARTMARAVLNARPAAQVRVCLCGCGREVDGKAITAGPSCRKRMQRKRENVTDLAA